jgi:MFS family permease
MANASQTLEAAAAPVREAGARGWLMVAIAVLGISTGPAAFGVGSIGVFLEGFQRAHGWSRAEISSAITLLMLFTAFSVPVAGWLVDRYGPRRVLAPSIVALGLCMAALPHVRELWQLQAAYIAMGTIAAGSNSVAYMRVLTSWFDRRRGLAIGLAGSGTGLGFAYVPLLAQSLKDAYGFAAGYYGLAALALFATLPLVVLFLRERGDGASASEPAPAAAEGMSLAQAVRGRDFWVLAAMFMSVTTVLYGLLPHLVPLIAGNGVAQAQAAQIASLFGLATFAGRIVIGFLVDRFDARRIALAFFLISAAGLPLLAADLPLWAVFVSALLLGGSLGAEVDMLAYLVSRYFGLRSFARIFGVLFGAVMLAMGAGPLVFGAIFDRTGSYDLMLWAGAPACAVAALLTLALRPYAQRRRGGPVSVT